MDLMYVKAMEEYDLKIGDLPEDAQTGIEQIKAVLKGIHVNESKGKNISDGVYKKLRAMDKWVYYEILDLVEETNQNKEEIPYTAEEVEEEIEEEVEDDDDDEDEQEDSNAEEVKDEDDEADFKSAPTGDPVKGQTIEADFKIAYENGKTKITLEELKNVSKTAYNVIFENYDDSGDNGIITTNYTLLETDEYVFTLEKN